MSLFVNGCSSIAPKAEAADVLGLIQSRIDARLSEVFTEMSKNLHLAIDAGELPATDPAVPCVDSILADLGLKQGSGPSYTTDNIGGRSAVLYIRLQNIQKSKPEVQAACNAIIGKLMIDGVKNGPVGR